MWRDLTLRLKEREASHALFTWSLQVTCFPADTHTYTHTHTKYYLDSLYFIFLYLGTSPKWGSIIFTNFRGVLTQLVCAMMMNYPALLRQYISDGLSRPVYIPSITALSRVCRVFWCEREMVILHMQTTHIALLLLWPVTRNINLRAWMSKNHLLSPLYQD